MSGSGGGGGSDDWRPISTPVPPGGGATGGAGGGAGAPNPCIFTEVAILSSPNSQVIGGLSIGSVLSVVLQQAPLRVVVMTGSAIAGSITSARLADIIQCIRAGQQYEAKVTQINGGAVTVEVYPI
jgi:hypothetical protein